MSRLNFDYFVWLDADTVFVRNPVDVLAPLGHSPIHVPLEVNLSTLSEDRDWKGVSVFRLRDFFRREGIANEVYLSQSAFWIVHRDAIDEVYELALGFWNRAKDRGLRLNVDAGLGYAMQILCADPEVHRLLNHPDLWASDDGEQFEARLPDEQPWLWRHALGGAGAEIRPAIVHLRTAKGSSSPRSDTRGRATQADPNSIEN